MSAQISINPVLTNNAQGSFQTQSDGYIQGVALDDPAVRNQLAGGYLVSAETLPMWGGVGISEIIPGGANTPARELGGGVSRATSIATPTDTSTAGILTGFSVFNQDHAMINTPQSPVPLAATNMLVNFYRLGSLARIAVKCDPALISKQGKLITSLVSWDYVAQMLVAYSPAYTAAVVSGATWSAGVATFTVNVDYQTLLSAGDRINVSGVVSTGGGSYNGNWVVVDVPDATHVRVTMASTGGTFSSNGALAAGGGALPCKIIDVQATNCMTVLYDSATGFATWDRNGACALIQI